MLIGPLGASFLRQVQFVGTPVLTWTVNDRERMRWCIRKGLDGVITDDPKSFLEECEAYSIDPKPNERLSIWTLVDVVRVHLMAFVFGLIFIWKYGDRLL